MSDVIDAHQLDRLTSQVLQRIARLKQLHVPGGPPELQHDDQDAELFLRNCAAIDHQVSAQATREVTRLRDNLDCWLAMRPVCAPNTAAPFPMPACWQYPAPGFASRAHNA
ncbi:hypothetical protein BBI09_14490 [Stutzerimonas xanthomarina]|nr:hypothetical protein BBI09_14490 [Stutzerimonas xanthomarina]